MPHFDQRPRTITYRPMDKHDCDQLLEAFIAGKPIFMPVAEGSDRLFQILSYSVAEGHHGTFEMTPESER